MSGEGFGSLDQGRHVVLFVAMGVSAHRAWRATRISGFLLFRPPMLASLFSATLRILFFSAGPQDFPYDPRLTAPLAVSAGLANGLMLLQVLQMGAALVMAIRTVWGLAQIGGA